MAHLTNFWVTDFCAVRRALESEDSAHRAVRGAANARRQESFNQATSWPLRIGIGIHSAKWLPQYPFSPAQGVHRDRRHRELCRPAGIGQQAFNSRLLNFAAVRDALDEAGSDAVSLGKSRSGHDRPMTVWQLG